MTLALVIGAVYAGLVLVALVYGWLSHRWWQRKHAREGIEELNEWLRSI